MNQLLRIISTDSYKGTRNYINSQKKFEVLRTILLFGMSLGLFLAGYIATGKKENLLTIVAVVGCLPASKSLIGAIMYLRYKSCPKTAADMIDTHIGHLNGLYDMVFTSYQKNFSVNHMVIHANSIYCYTSNNDFPEKEFQIHIEGILKNDGHKNISVKLFKDIQKYIDRLDQLQELEAENKHVNGVLETLKSVVL